MKFHEASNDTGLISKFYPSRRETPKQVDVQNLSGCYITLFWVVGPCIVLESMGALPRVGAQPPPLLGRASHLSYAP
jgi:hypothetical protein